MPMRMIALDCCIVRDKMDRSRNGVFAKTRKTSISTATYQAAIAEGRSLVRAIDQLEVDVLMDMHTTNGSLHRYPLTYDIPHNLAAPSNLLAWLRESFLTQATDRMAALGIQPSITATSMPITQSGKPTDTNPATAPNTWAFEVASAFSVNRIPMRPTKNGSMHPISCTCLLGYLGLSNEIESKSYSDKRISASRRTSSHPRLPLQVKIIPESKPVEVLGYAYPKPKRKPIRIPEPSVFRAPRSRTPRYACTRHLPM